MKKSCCSENIKEIQKDRHSKHSNCHPELVSGSRCFATTQAEEIPDQVRNDTTKQHSGMPSLLNKNAFTLIELLVVVLIIGILAAIALPQYQKAVKKAKYAKMLSWVKTVADAEKLYYLNHGEYTTSFEELGLNTSTKTCSGWLSGGPLWNIDGICIGVVKQPGPAVVWGSLYSEQRRDNWNGYAYLLKKYNSKVGEGLHCMEGRVTRDPHCGEEIYSDAYGHFCLPK